MISRQDAFMKGYKEGMEESNKKLFLIETISTFRHRYVIEAESLEHAYDEVTMSDSSSPEDLVESADQKFLGETIINGRKINKKKFKKFLIEIEKENTGSYWMGEGLIRKVDYKK